MLFLALPASGAIHEQKSTSRYALEIDFYTGAFSFCVGWGYIVVLRDLSYLVAAATALLGTTEDNDGHADADMLATIAEPTFLALFIVGATAALLALQEKGLPKPLVRAVTTPIEQVTRWWSAVSSGRRRTSPIVRMNGGSDGAGLLQHAVPPGGSSAAVGSPLAGSVYDRTID